MIDYDKIADRVIKRFSRAIKYLAETETHSQEVSIGVTEVYRLVEEIEKRKLTSGSIIISNGIQTGIGEPTFAQFPGEDTPVEITDHDMW